MHHQARRRRTWIVALSLSVLLIAAPKLVALRRDREFDPRSLKAGPDWEASEARLPFPVVAWPDSLKLLRVVEGLEPGDTVVGPACGAGIIVPENAGLPLVARLRWGLRRDTWNLSVMRWLAGVAMDDTLSMWERFLANFLFQMGLSRIDSIASNTRFQGIPLLDGTDDVCVEGVPVYVDLPDANLAALGLDGPDLDLTTPTNAAGAMTSVEWALFVIEGYWFEANRDRRDLQDGAADGGLRGQMVSLKRMRDAAMQATDGTISQHVRLQLDVLFQDDRARVDAIAHNMRFQGIDLLDGVLDVDLEGPPPNSAMVFVDLPDTTAFTLGLLPAYPWFDLTTWTNAVNALTTVDHAIEIVQQHRDDITMATQDLLNS